MTAIAERLEARGWSTTWRTVASVDRSAARRLVDAARLQPGIVALQPTGQVGVDPDADVAFAVHTYLAPHLAEAPAAIARAYDVQDVEWRHLASVAQLSPGVRSFWLRGQAKLMRRFERRVFSEADVLAFVSQADRDESVADHVTGAIVAPSVLPAEEQRRAEAIRVARSTGVDSQDLLYVGTLAYPPNALALQAFVAETWPTVHAASPNARLLVAGRAAPALASVLSAAPGVEVLGWVEELPPLLSSVAAAVMPVHAQTGSSLRALVFALGEVPVLNSPDAVRGLPFDTGEQVSTPDAWARAVGRLLDDAADPHLLRRIRFEAEALHSDEAPWDALDTALRRAVTVRRALEGA